MFEAKLTSINRPAIFLYTILFAGLFAVGSLALAGNAIAQSEDIWLRVDTSALTLSVMQGDRILHTYENIAIGSNGTTREKRVKDEKTPLGEFTIDGIRTSNHFHLFLSINYPNMEHARRGLKNGSISSEEYHAVSEAWRNGESPPQNTSLGGHLGIHGIGAGSLEIHNNVNWTNGCIAVTNEQVEELAAWVRVGTRVSVR
jgi:murein L,D-transpeptidase YafK